LRFLFSKWTKFWATNFLQCENDIFLIQDEFIFSHFIVLSPNIFYLKKTKYITRCNVKSSIISKVKLILIVHFLFSKKRKTLCDHVRCPEKIIFLSIQREIPFFLFHIWNKLFFINCRAFHAVSCTMFCFLIQRIKWLKIEMQNIVINLPHPLVKFHTKTVLIEILLLWY
jgi:hypothetical protein